MRLRYLLPTVQILFSIFFVLIPIGRYLPHYRAKSPDGVEVICHDNCPPLPSVGGLDPQTLIRGVNLPAIPAVGLLLSVVWNQTHDGHDYLQDPIWQCIGLSLSGVFLWFFVGRFTENLIALRRTKLLSRTPIADAVFFAATSIISTALLFTVVRLSGQEFWWLLCWSLFWTSISYGCLIPCVILLLKTTPRNSSGRQLP